MVDRYTIFVKRVHRYNIIAVFPISESERRMSCGVVMVLNVSIYDFLVYVKMLRSTTL